MKLFVVLINWVLCFSLAYERVETRTDSDENLLGHDDLVNDRNDNLKKSIAALLANDGSEIYPSMSNDSPFGDYRHQIQNQQQYGSPIYRKHQTQRSQSPSYDPRDGTPYTREVAVKQGRIKGIVRVMHPQSGLKSVDQYLGIPYAEAPVGSRRFMPPSAPIPWTGLKMAIKLSPVCPQNLPTLNNVNNNYSKGRYDQLKRLLPYLKVESEDCLYLNLYVPSYDGIGPQAKYPVIVYIHGESYEWNSGNPYDGSILASYGRVIVVTLNFRLGILGFMKPGISDHTTSNFGLLDQIAALQWIKENIGAFGGDHKLVTVMGHGTGAACVNFLMVSPVAKGLFHRSILLSGSALSDWALTQHPLQSTMQVLQGLNCPLNGDNDEVAACLRRKRYSEILNVKIASPQFSTRFGPIVDGLVIPNTPHKVMGQYSDIFSGYDLLYGMSELESYNILNAVALTYGLLENERDNLLRFYMQNRFEIRPDLALAATLNEYTGILTDPNKSLADIHRDTLLDILSDARVAAPMMQTGLYLAKVNPKCYMYVFAHNSEAGEYGRLSQSVVGEDLAYVFGAPLGQVGPFQTHYNARERLFSEAVMKYFSNFAQTGNPKAPWKDLFLNMNPEDWRYYDVDWPEFNSVNQSFLHLGLTPVVSRHYRQKYMKFWNQKLPEELKRITTSKPYSPYSEFLSPPDRRITTSSPEFITGHINLFPIKVDIEKPTEDSFKALVYRMKDSHAGSSGMYNAPAPSMGISAEAPVKESPEPANVEQESDGSDILKTDASLTMLIAVAIVFLLFNIFVIVGYVIKRSIGNKKVKRQFDDNILESAASMNDKRSKLNDADESYILDMIRKTNPYEPVMKANNFTLPRQFSGETVDPHTKVCDWISQDYCPNQPECDGVVSLCQPDNQNVPQKISVAIDATPQARSNSILRQEPIEITKAKSFEYASPDDYEESVSQNSPCDSDVRQQCSSSGSSYSYNDCDYKIEPKMLKSNANPIYNNHPCQGEEITSFIESGDINVTSRDKSVEKDPLSPEEALKVIQRRNFPKVLPDYPSGITGPTASMKRRSLPPQSFMLSSYNSLRRDSSRLVPAPPPRISSTLGRRSSKHRASNNFLSSPPLMAEEPPIEEEPTISLNTLHIGPLLPKHQESTYVTMSRQNSEDIEQEEPAVDIICIEHKPESHYSYIKPPSMIKPPSSFKTSPPKEIDRSDSRSELQPMSSASLSRLPITRSAALQRELSSESSATDTTSSSTGTIKKM
ncbi:neuroligin-1 [Topomyia yanbarensis]|uniref:neuroligin-1 n=1 Tax=Topomyia yanbarensis TaxID=2498891 RepID=UPI00273A7AAE|nr:neuroligin-1 [Topomyia yanbarensis]XP_058821518.1 neuroligin-1 [Topomyia yanbarensis]XP_058821520.1 neuroligin-1 [Topomyia yanbarensis]XP_058821521.1 neuroligin-1 [Topomyia yanbarensis]